MQVKFSGVILLLCEQLQANISASMAEVGEVKGQSSKTAEVRPGDDSKLAILI